MSDRKAFSTDFRSELMDLLRWRRDVRRFRTDPVDEAVLSRCLDTFSLAPSVGLSEPWRLIRVDSATARKAALENFRAENTRALTATMAKRPASTALETVGHAGSTGSAGRLL